MTGWSYHPPQADLYQVLGVGRRATREEIARAYRQLARSAHPDAHPADPQAAARFQALTSAYDVLSDPARRDDYDRRQAAAMPPPPPSWPGAAWPVPPGGPPLRAGPVRVQPPLAADPGRGQPPGAAAGGDRGQAGDLDALVMLARLLSRYPGLAWDWLGDDRGWPDDDRRRAGGWPW